ncbi:uncharacterized protein FOMMEDRAFT_22707 [Fomitiporia mediterranea MF3/22]|uniref:uncharacterized protein n=1 Tax=Fomitiporia mediterranea (strain MF3/22) TaxID=694068 RepID=UPI000440835F|nr:uncharacterized protein FOMMEDRAFT_22707 [Fomitiporia mediterranea MF3/22]EJD00254.1 hypothetical protein FOMMEDRAFT_22707 [Fomitiporia mediterranea MF3/22]
MSSVRADIAEIILCSAGRVPGPSLSLNCSGAHILASAAISHVHLHVHRACTRHELSQTQNLRHQRICEYYK